MSKQKRVYSYPAIGLWLKETMSVMRLTQECVRTESHIGKEQLGKLLKGGHQVQLLGSSFLHRHGVAQR